MRQVFFGHDGRVYELGGLNVNVENLAVSPNVETRLMVIVPYARDVVFDLVSGAIAPPKATRRMEATSKP
jgi:hypothetical protein